MKKLVSIIGIISALGAGAFLLNAVGPASAGSLSTKVSAADSPDPSSGSSGAPSAPGACDARPGVKGVLDGLVTKGTITQDQEDAIIQALQDARGDAPGRGVAGRRAARVIKGAVQVAADKIGVSVDDLRAAFKDGKSIADVANEHNVAPADVVQAIVDAGSKRIDDAVSAGKLTTDQGTRLKARLPEVADKLVNRTKPDC